MKVDDTINFGVFTVEYTLKLDFPDMQFRRLQVDVKRGSYV